MTENKTLRKIGHLAGNLILAGLLGWLAYTNIRAFFTYGSISALVLTVAESILVISFVIRKEARAFSLKPSDWLVSIMMLVVPILFRPDQHNDLFQGTLLNILGALLLTWAYASLGTSISLAPALRDIKTRGMFVYVRHPIYASYILLYGGYYLSHPTVWNAFLMMSFFPLMVSRIKREETFLAQDETYRSYVEHTPWKIIPFLY